MSVYFIAAKLTCRTYLAFTYTFLIILIIIFVVLFVLYYRKQQRRAKKQEIREQFGNMPPPGYMPGQPVFSAQQHSPRRSLDEKPAVPQPMAPSFGGDGRKTKFIPTSGTPYKRPGGGGVNINDGFDTSSDAELSRDDSGRVSSRRWRRTVTDYRL